MPSYEVLVPDLGSDAGADVIEILCKPGDQIKKDDIVLVLESDKATMEIPSPADGVVKEVLVALGDKAFSDDKIVLLASDGGAASDVVDEDQVANDIEAMPDAPVAGHVSATQQSAFIDERVPDLGDDSAAEVIELNVSVGQMVNVDDVLLVMESDKATMEIPASQAGKVSKVYINVGDQLKTGDVTVQLSVLGLETEAEVSIDVPVVKSVVEAPVKQKTPKRKTRVSVENQLKPMSAKVHAGPASRRLARELGVDLAEVNGTGPKTRILKDDVKAFVKERLNTESKKTSGLDLELPTIDFSKFGEVEEKALSRIQKVSAKNLTRSWLTIPHVTQFDEADITALDSFRKEQAPWLKEQGIKLTLLAFLVKASAYSLKEFPNFNASLNKNGDRLILKKYFNIGVAVDTPNGLVVPVIKDANNKGISEIAKELQILSERARDKKLTPQEMQGGCFSISSLGGIGGTAFTPIVNWPEVSILGVSKASIKPVYKNNEFVPRLILPLSLSYDHRVIDGAEAARFSKFICELLSDIRKLTL